MLRSAIICPDGERSKRLLRALESVHGFSVKSVVDQYPSFGELRRMFRSSDAQVLFLSLEDLQRAGDIIKVLEVELPEIQVVGVHGVTSSETLRASMRLGVRELLWEPFEAHAMGELLAQVKGRVQELAAHSAQSQLLCFLPSKPGVGASTLALNVGAALAARPNSSVLLGDFDLSAGMIRFLLRLNSKSSLTDAIELAPDLDNQVWSQLVTRRKGLDVLHSGDMKPNHHIAPALLEELLAYFRHAYKFVCADLSGNFERHSLELLQEATTIFLVCTPELSSLHLAREKLDFLRQVHAHSKVSIILNRVIKKPLFITQQVEEFLSVPVSQMFANDYEGVNRAVMAGTTIAATSELGKQFAQFATRLDGPALLSPESAFVAKEVVGKETISWSAGQWQLKNA